MRYCATLSLLVVSSSLQAADAIAELHVDLSDVARRVVHSHSIIPVSSGPQIVYYPKWIPGTHGPIGPISEQAGLHIKAGSKSVAWKRDDEDPYGYHITVPAGVNSIDVAFDLVLQPAGTGSWLGTTLTAASPKLAILNWNEVVIYPKADGVMSKPFKATIKLPAGWKYGSALRNGKVDGDKVEFPAVSLEELIDSPLLCGEYLKEVSIGNAKGPKHRVVLACDSEAGLEVPPETKSGWDGVVNEAGKLFGTRHYRAYTFLVALSDQTGVFAVEHHESSDNRLPERALITPDVWKTLAGVMPHEYVHSWNGKFRRPAEMIVADFQKAQKTRLLWVYEGLTNYLGWVLAARGGLWKPEDARESLALQADKMATSRGRTWRALDDTAVANFVILPAPQGWTSYRRSLDYYDEGTLIWLEIDVMIRQKTNGLKSLDDFCQIFHGGTGGAPRVKGYTFDDLVTALNEVMPYDWKSHLARRVSVPNETPPLEGITGGGWKLSYQEKPSPMFETGESVSKGLNLGPSIGLLLNSEGKVLDIIPDGPAAKAGIAPGMKLVAVNDRKYSDTGLKAAVAATKTKGKLELLTETGEFYKSHIIEYKGGLKYPVLERGDSTDVLSLIMQPRESSSEK
jgi:predicted metalloprotease with PDZ domain